MQQGVAASLFRFAISCGWQFPLEVEACLELAVYLLKIWIDFALETILSLELYGLYFKCKIRLNSY